MFGAGVAEVQASVLASLPAELNRVRASAWSQEVLGTTSIGSFLEGPCPMPDGTLLVSDLAHGRILRLSPSGVFDVVFEYHGEPNGLALGADGVLFIADYRRGLLTLDLESLELRTVVDRYRLEPFRGLSDLAFGPDGSLYFSDQGQSDLRFPTGRLFRWDPASGLSLLVDSIPSPNGVAVSPDGSLLYLAVTRANCVYRVPLWDDGRIGKVGVHFHSAGGSGGPDGLAVGRDGSLVVAQYGAGRAWVLDALGIVTASVTSRAGLGITNVAFLPDSAGRLLLTEAGSGSILQAELGIPGAPLFAGPRHGS
ncbi:gluconolactonase [Nocardioides sp. J9]|uniref:SMP-30/gluconolactonase/LRE family protein n=1 Tax=Nocardioides sp. J9 TaxID=935844 RepID=UPI0011A9B4F5|nr:SMP-30/gluconolactonase/LRE family protein [Nocardioides sp. J9]TWG98566.1 gluconolactonase [Nocardioides sp. J9]